MSLTAPGPAVLPEGGERVARVLERQGVRCVFTLCGGHIAPILVACKARGIRVVDVRHEATAVFAADGAARLTGVPGVAVVTAGPGVTNTLTAVENALLAHSPLVLLGGAAPTLLRGRGALQDIDQVSAVRPFVKQVFPARTLAELIPALEQAFATAKRGIPGPVFVECPIDLLYPESVVREWYAAGTGRSGRGLAQRALGWYVGRHVERLFSRSAGEPGPLRPAPPQEPPGLLLGRAARLLAAAERPLLLVGSQALCRAEQAGAVAGAVEALGIPTYLAGMARGLLGPDHPLQVRHKRRQALKEADLVILAGVPCDFRLDYGRGISRRARVVAVNLSLRQALKNRLPSLPIPADPGLFLQRLAQASGGGAPAWAGWREELARRDGEREAEIEAMAREEAPPVHPLRLCQAMERTLGPEAILVADGGDFVASASYVLRPRRPLSWLDPGVFGTLGVGAGFALAAAVTRPGAEVWLLWGDGAAGFSLMELDTFARHGLGVVAVIGNDGGWTQIARDQRTLLRDDVGTVLAQSDYHLVAEGLGGVGFKLDDPAALDATLARAREVALSGRPALVNAHIGTTRFREGSISM